MAVRRNGGSYQVMRTAFHFVSENIPKGRGLAPLPFAFKQKLLGFFIILQV